MTAKKRWLNYFHDSQESCSKTQLSISWSSSESEDEFTKYIHAKKMKKNVETNCIWIKPKINEAHAQNYVTNFAYPSTSNCDGPFSVLNWSQLNPVKPLEKFGLEKPCEKQYNIEDSESITSCAYESIITNLKLEESPILNRNPSFKAKISPVLGKTGFLRNIIKSRYKLRIKSRNAETESLTMSPDLFTSQSTAIIECESPEDYDNYSSSITDSNISQSSECMDIDPLLSPCNSRVLNFNTDSSLGRTNNNGYLYHRPIPKRKRYKKGGLASLLQKTLHLQRTRIAICQHEIYTKKIDFTSMGQEEIIEFSIRKKWKEYGNLLLECEVSNKTDTSSDLFASGSTDNERVMFIIVIGFNTPYNIKYQMDQKYKLIPPYSTKNIPYKSKYVLCCFNVTKLILA